MIENKDYEPEIDLKKLLSYILRRWKPMITVAFGLGIILGGYKYVDEVNDLNNTELLAKEVQTYETELESYELEKKNSERQIKNLTVSIERQEEYLSNSILMNTSPYNVQVASADLYIETGYQILPENTYQEPNPANSILAAYNTLITNGDLFRRIEKKVSAEVADMAYIKELVTVTTSKDAPVLSLQVKGTDMAKNENILREALVYIQSRTPDVCRQVADHTLEIINQSNYTEVDMDLYDSQMKQNDALTKLNESLKKEKEELAALKKPTMQEPSMRNVIKSAVKFALIGDVGGVCLMGFWLCVMYVLNNTIQDANQLKQRYCLNVLGALRVSHNRKKSAITRLCDNLDGLPQKDIPESQQLAVIAENMKHLSKEVNHIMVLGIDQSENSQKIFNALTVEGKLVEAGENAVYDADAVSKLSDSDAVVFVVTLNKTTIDEFKQNVDSVEAYGKKLLGVIFI